MCGNPEKNQKEGEAPAYGPGESIGGEVACYGINRNAFFENGTSQCETGLPEMCPCLDTHSPNHSVAYGIRLANTSGNGIGVREEQTPTLTTRGPDAAAYLLRIRGGKEGGGKGALLQTERSGTIATSNDQTLFATEGDSWTIRHLTPTECERLQGFPDGHTDLTGCEPEDIGERVCLSLGAAEDKERKALLGKISKWCSECPDGPRYKACGNSMAVPVIRWIGERTEMVDDLVVDLMLEGEL